MRRSLLLIVFLVLLLSGLAMAGTGPPLAGNSDPTEALTCSDTYLTAWSAENFATEVTRGEGVILAEKSCILPKGGGVIIWADKSFGRPNGDGILFAEKGFRSPLNDGLAISGVKRIAFLSTGVMASKGSSI